MIALSSSTMKIKRQAKYVISIAYLSSSLMKKYMARRVGGMKFHSSKTILFWPLSHLLKQWEGLCICLLTSQSVDIFCHWPDASQAFCWWLFFDLLKACKHIRSSLRRIFRKIWLPSFIQNLVILRKTAKKPSCVWTESCQKPMKEQSKHKIEARFGLSMLKNTYGF